jgi:hypothetical protein
MILSPYNARILWRTSWCSLASVIGGLAFGHVWLAGSAGVVLLTSLNLWRAPVRGWRFWMDVGAVQFALVAHIWMALRAPFFWATTYGLLTGAGMLCFLAGMQAHRQGRERESALWHAGLHVAANAGNLALYWGLLAG